MYRLITQIFLLLSPALALGQFTGIVTDSRTGAPLEGVLVTADTGASTFTNSDGVYEAVNHQHPE